MSWHTLAAVLFGGALLQAPQQPPRDPRLRPSPMDEASISGTITSDDTEPRRLRRVLVTLNGAALEHGGRTVITDDAGQFRFDGLPAGQYGLTAVKEGYVPARFHSLRPPRVGSLSTIAATGLSVGRGESVTADLRLARGAVVTGVVTDPDGRPEEGILMTASSYRFLPGAPERRLFAASRGIFTTDDRGVYRIFGLPAGEYVISAQRGAGNAQQAIRQSSTDSRPVIAAPVYFPSTTDLAAATRLTLAQGEERRGIDVQMRYVPTATIAGMAASPPGSSSGRVSLTRRTGQPGAIETVAVTLMHPDGGFTISGIVPGHYTVYAIAETAPGVGTDPADGTWSSGSIDVDVDGEDVVGITIPTSATLTLKGTLVFEGGSAPAARFGRMTVPIAPIGGGYGTPGPHFRPLDDSHFEVSGVIPGPYRITGTTAPGIRTPLGSWWVKSVVIGGREALDGAIEIRRSTDAIVVTLAEQASTVSGVARDAHGVPVPGAYVVIFGADHASWFFNSRRVAGDRTDPRGHYTIRNLPPGEYRATVALDLEPGEWFDPQVLQQLLAAAVPVTVFGAEAQTLDLILR